MHLVDEERGRKRVLERREQGPHALALLYGRRFEVALQHQQRHDCLAHALLAKMNGALNQCGKGVIGRIAALFRKSALNVLSDDLER